MNLLAHQLLAAPDGEAMVGNYLADHLRGATPKTMPKGVVHGIEMHRFIDRVTDEHPATKASVQRLSFHIGRYASVAVDVFYDHLLAIKWEQLGIGQLSEFAQMVYQNLHSHIHLFSDRSLGAFTAMRKHDWLSNYATEAGMAKTLEGLAKRAKFPSNLDKALLKLLDNLKEYEIDFSVLWADLEKHVANFNKENNTR